MIKRYFVVILILISSVPSLAQSSSPFSRIGLGDLISTFSSRRVALGGLGAAIEDADFISTLNPASINKLSRVRIEVGFNYNAIFLSDQNQSTYYGDAQFNGFTFAFPVYRDYGVAAIIGLVPITEVGYKTVQKNTNPDAPRIMLEGNGGLSKIFVGGSYSLPFNLSLGATFDYYFGNLDYKSTTQFSSTDLTNAEYKKSLKPKGVGTSLGIISPDLSKYLVIKNISDITIGVSANILGNLKTDTLLSSISSISEDTITIGNVDIKVPIKINAGLAFKLNSKYLFSIDYSTQAWSNYSIGDKKISELRNYSKYSLGFEYKPNKESGNSFWNQTALRCGASYEQTQYLVNNSGINSLLLSAGLSFPLSYENTIDISATYGFRKSSDASLFKENFVRLNFGLSLGDIWFVRMER